MRQLTIILLLLCVGLFGISAKGGCLDALTNKDDSGSSGNTNNGEPGPTNFVGNVISSTRIDLSWEYGGIMITDFKIERSTDGVNFSQLAIVSLAAVNWPTCLYSDTSVNTAATTYHYRIRGWSDRNGNTNYSTTVTLP